MAFDLAKALKNVSDSGTDQEQLVSIPLDLIDEDPNNFYQLSDIPTLADNITLCGLQQPIRVRQKEDGRYIIVSGHRRRAALEMLVADGYEKFRQASCIVEQDVVSPALQQLRLIYANANTRKMTSAEISEQAQQVEKLLYQLKEEGYDFPGRMRDHVAEAVGQSKSKLARLKMIRENLAACWVDLWKDGTLTESQAYALAQMPKSWQTLIFENYGLGFNSLYADTITRFRDRFQKITKIECQYGLALCEHTVEMMRRSCHGSCYDPCDRCCFECHNLQTCKIVCPEAKAKQKEMKAVAKKASFDAKREQEERDRPGTEFARLVWQRIGLARRISGATVEQIVSARGESCYEAAYDDPKQEKQENGEGLYGPNEKVSFGYGISAADMMKVVAVADLLHCSVDYLLGRTDRMELVPDSDAKPEAKETVSNLGTAWNVGSPEESGDYLLILRDPYDSVLNYEHWSWNGAVWEHAGGHGRHYPDIDGEILGWMPLPKAPEENLEAPLNDSCITGMSPSGHCGAAACCDSDHTCCLQCDEPCNSRCGWVDDVEVLAENEE